MSTVSTDPTTAFMVPATARSIELRQQGKSWTEIGEVLGVHRTSAMRMYRAAMSTELAKLADLRERSFYEDLADIQDKLDLLNAEWAPTPEKLPMLAAIVKLIETKAKFLRYADLKFTTDAAGKSKEELLDELATHARTMGARLDEALREREVIDVGEG